MKWTVSAVAAAFVLGAVIGGSYALTQPLKAAGMPMTYGVYEANVTDPDNYKSQFLSVVVPKLKQNNIKYLAVGGKTQTAIGDEPKNRIVLTEGSMDDQMAFWKDAKDDFKIGQKYSTGMRLYFVEGVSQ
jgi:uncharacterized protein (DUF1330 family)